MTICCFPDFDCTAKTVDGTGYCVLHLGVMRARKCAELFPDEPDEADLSDCALEGLGQGRLVLGDAA